MAATLYYIFPFGQSADDLTTIPQSPAVGGGVSYHNGWTALYEEDLNTDPTAKPIPRGQTNQLFYDITNNIQEYQQYGSPNWITALDNGGSSFEYPIYARVYYLGVVYENQVAANTATPGADTTWLQISGNLQGVPAGTVIWSAGYPLPTGYLRCDGAAISRTTFLSLRNSITNTQNGHTTNTSAVVTALTSTSGLYAGMPVEGANIPLATTILTIDSGTQVTLSHSATGTATSPITFFPWGNGDNATTFNTPDLRRRSFMGSSGSSTATLGNAIGQKGGAETATLQVTNLPPHTHNAADAQQYLTTGSGFNYGNGGSGLQLEGTSAPTGDGTAFSILPPLAILNPYIKF